MRKSRLFPSQPPLLSTPKETMVALPVSPTNYCWYARFALALTTTLRLYQFFLSSQLTQNEEPMVALLILTTRYCQSARFALSISETMFPFQFLLPIQFPQNAIFNHIFTSHIPSPLSPYLLSHDQPFRPILPHYPYDSWLINELSVIEKYLSDSAYAFLLPYFPLVEKDPSVKMCAVFTRINLKV